MRRIKRLLGALVGLTAIAYAGLQVRPKPPAKPASRPCKVQAWGRGRIAIARLWGLGALYAPFTWRLDLDPGVDYVFQAKLCWFGKPVLTAGDEMGSPYPDAWPGLPSEEEMMLCAYTAWFAPNEAKSEEIAISRIPGETGVASISLRRADKRLGAVRPYRIDFRLPHDFGFGAVASVATAYWGDELHAELEVDGASVGDAEPLEE